MKYYAIKHKPTGLFMPQMRGGFSYWEPKGEPQPPRLFATRRAAANALTCWANGRYAKRFVTTQDSWDEPYYQSEAGTEAEPDITRRRDDLQVVEITLS